MKSAIITAYIYILTFRFNKSSPPINGFWARESHVDSVFFTRISLTALSDRNTVLAII